MALTVTRTARPRKVGNRKVTQYEVAFDNSYASEGEPLAPSDLGLRRVDRVECDIVAGSESSTLRPTNCHYKGGKLHLIDSATGKEMEATKDMSKVKVAIVAEGV